MNKEFISDKQGIALITFIIIADKVIFAVAEQAERDFWMSVILAMAISVPILLMFARLNFLFPEKNLFDINEYICGEFFGKIFNILFIFYVVCNSLVILDTFVEFVNTVSLVETPMVVTTIGIIFICIWASKEGIEVLGRCSLLFLIWTIILMLTVILLLTLEMDIDNIFPILDNGIKPVIEGALLTVGFPLTEAIMFTMIFSSSTIKNSPYRIYMLALLIGGLLILLISLSEVLVLGINRYLNVYFPSYISASRLDVGNFIQRLEIIPSAAFILGGFVKISICLIAISKGISRTFACNDYRFLVTPIGLLIGSISLIFTDSMTYLFVWATEIFPKFAFPFQIVLPIMIWIIAEMKKKKMVNN